jgi:site-specific recombinase XerD
MKTTEPSFPVLLQQFFTQRLMQQKKVSPHTLCSYRDTFRLLLRFANKKLHTTPEQLSIEQIDAPMVTAFLNDLENSRGVSARTRNLRLTAIRSFFRFASYELPGRSFRPIVDSHPEMAWALLEALAQRVRTAESRS